MKKILSKILLVIVCICCLFLIVAGCLVLAPGFSILGVCYIRSTSGSVNQSFSKYCASSEFENVVVNANNIPIYVVFAQNYDANCDLIERYNGFTKTLETPHLTMDASTKDLTFNCFEYEPFIYHNRHDDSGLYLYVPEYFAGGVIVNSVKSDVVVTGLIGVSTYLEINTNGDVTVENNLSTKDFSIDCGNGNLKIEKGCTITGDLTIKTTTGDAEVKCPIGGQLTFKTENGKLNFNSCKSLNVTAKRGGVGPITDEDIKEAIVETNANIKCNGDVKISVKGDATIDSKNGNIVLGKEGEFYNSHLNLTTKGGDIDLPGDYKKLDNKIVSDSGNIKINKIMGATILCDHGYVEIKQCSSLNLENGSADAKIMSIIVTANITSRGGKIEIGEEDTDVYGILDIKTFGGEINLKNVKSGAVTATTESGNINIENNPNTETVMDLKSKRGDISVKDVNAKTNIETRGSVNINIYKFNAPVTINGRNGSINVVLNSFGYLDLQSKRKKVIKAPGLEKKAKEYITKKDGDDPLNLLTIKTHRGKISVVEQY